MSTFYLNINHIWSTWTKMHNPHNLAQGEFVTLQKYINENLGKKFIQHSKSSTNALIQFLYFSQNIR